MRGNGESAQACVSVWVVLPNTPSPASALQNRRGIAPPATINVPLPQVKA